MIVRATAQRIALFRRSATTIVTSTGLVWEREFIDVTQELINAATFSLSHVPVVDSELIMLNGLPMTEESGWDYQISGNVVIFLDTSWLTVGDTIRIKYQRTA